MSRRVIEFSTYCIGNVAEALKMNQADVYRLLKSSGILRDYIVDAFEVTHTLGQQYITEDIIHMMRQRGVL